MAKKIQFRRGPASDWVKYNPILDEGELGLETDTKNFKIGDGVTTWINLEYGAKGAKGDPGLKGDKGDISQPGMNFFQVVASTEWTIPHNLGYRPSVSIFNVGGIEVEGDIIHLTNNTLKVFFNTAIAGSARLS